MTEVDTEFLHRLIRWANFCAGEGLFSDVEDPTDILYDWFQVDGDAPECWPKDVRKEWVG